MAKAKETERHGREFRFLIQPVENEPAYGCTLYRIAPKTHGKREKLITQAIGYTLSQIARAVSEVGSVRRVINAREPKAKGVRPVRLLVRQHADEPVFWDLELIAPGTEGTGENLVDHGTNYPWSNVGGAIQSAIEAYLRDPPMQR